MGALVAVRQGISVRVVEQRVVSIAPGKFLKGREIISLLLGVNHAGNVRVRGKAETHLGADTQVGIRHKFGLLM